MTIVYITQYSSRKFIVANIGHHSTFCHLLHGYGKNIYTHITGDKISKHKQRSIVAWQVITHVGIASIVLRTDKSLGMIFILFSYISIRIHCIEVKFSIFKAYNVMRVSGKPF